MKILIVGLGYAGNRYRRAFSYLGERLKIGVEIAYVGRHQRTDALPYFDRVSSALSAFRPDIVVVSVNDQSHVAILKELGGYRGFIICEKPLATPTQPWREACRGLGEAKGFALDLVERYSEATRQLKREVACRGWSLVRASFHWGKDRLNDYRPTCGVVSEVIHALDLVEWICPSEGALRLEGVVGVRSDFSISGKDVLDTVLLTASLGEVPVAGYSSFVNVQRQRTVDLSFVDEPGRIFHARIIYDTPQWDHDHLRIWTRDDQGREVLVVEQRTSESIPGLETLQKLSQFCEDVLRRVAWQESPSQPFADLTTATALQQFLDDISQKVSTPSAARYVRSAARVLLPEDADLESLG
ncbi:MAG: putative oxidoreductase [Proteobacteria bacterium]|nr:putative oxidoreductase [Pseudomonadota bacterium]